MAGYAPGAPFCGLLCEAVVTWKPLSVTLMHCWVSSPQLLLITTYLPPPTVALPYLSQICVAALADSMPRPTPAAHRTVASAPPAATSARPRTALGRRRPSRSRRDAGAEGSNDLERPLCRSGAWFSCSQSHQEAAGVRRDGR